jgi:UDP-3-O-[3-hydroxymyristoyl] glucosamine N-acyltransferase
MTGVDFGSDIAVYKNAQFCANATVEEGSVVFAAAIVGHGCRLGHCCVVAPGAVINARVELGDGVYVGTNASILPDLKIGAWATIGANSAVVQDVPAGATVMGVPAQVLIPGDADFSGEFLDAAVGGRRNPERLLETATSQPEETQIRSEAFGKLRMAQEKFISAHRSRN